MFSGKTQILIKFLYKKQRWHWNWLKISVGNTNTQIFIEFHRNLMNHRLEMNLYCVGCCLFGCFFFFAVNSMELQVWMTLLMPLILRASFCLQQQSQTCIGKKHSRWGNPKKIELSNFFLSTFLILALLLNNISSLSS